VHCGISTPIKNCPLHLFDKDALTSHILDLPRLVFIAASGDEQKLHIDTTLR